MVRRKNTGSLFFCGGRSKYRGAARKIFNVFRGSAVEKHLKTLFEKLSSPQSLKILRAPTPFSVWPPQKIGERRPEPERTIRVPGPGRSGDPAIRRRTVQDGAAARRKNAGSLFFCGGRSKYRGAARKIFNVFRGSAAEKHLKALFEKLSSPQSLKNLRAPTPFSVWPPQKSEKGARGRSE
ncbi:MAG: hypothetical protein ACOYJH_05065 [Anaerovoracaceae bacterium]